MAKPMTAKQRAALRRAQLASAAKRKGTGKGKPAPKGRRRKGMSTGTQVAIAAGAVVATAGAAYVAHEGSKYAHGAVKAEKRIRGQRARSDARKRLQAKQGYSTLIRGSRHVVARGGESAAHASHTRDKARAALRSRTSHKAAVRRKKVAKKSKR